MGCAASMFRPSHICWLIPIFLLMPSSPQAAVWEATRSWSEEWETKYSTWISEEVDENFLVPIHLTVDCADLAYVVRAIYSRNASLPFLAGDAGGGKIGHFLDRWDDLSQAGHWRKDSRFLAFLRLLVQHVTTKSYAYDTYPVRLCPETVRPGLMIYENLIAGHACLIGRIQPEQIIPITLFESSVPPRVRFKTTTQTNVYIYPPPVPCTHSGIVRWKWPIQQKGRWVFAPEESMPYYSLDIYDSTFPYRTDLGKALNRIVKDAAAGAHLSAEDHVRELVRYLQEEMQFRIRIVKEAEEILDRNPRIRSEEFDYTYNTDSRDERLFGLVRSLWMGMRLYDIPRELFFRALKGIPVAISKHLPETNLLFLFIAADQHWLSPDAYVSPEKRWGMRWDREAGEWIFNDRYSAKEVLSWYPTSVIKDQ